MSSEKRRPEIREWSRSSRPDEVLCPSETSGNTYGKRMIRRYFVNPDMPDEHPKKEEGFVLFGQKDWSVVLPVSPEGRVWAVRQFKQGCEKIILELPAGTADFSSETPEQVMRRELLQETGCIANGVIALQPQWIATRSSWTRFHPFLALGCEKIKDARWDICEQIEPVDISLSMWLRMVVSGNVEEPSAIVTTMLSLPHLSQELGSAMVVDAIINH